MRFIYRDILRQKITFTSFALSACLSDPLRRSAANWLAGLQVCGMIEHPDTDTLVVELATNLAQKAYRLVSSIILITKIVDKKETL